MLDLGYVIYFMLVLLAIGLILYCDIYFMSLRFKDNIKLKPSLSLFTTGCMISIMLFTISENFILHYILERYNILCGLLFIILCGLIYTITMVLIYNISLMRIRRKVGFENWLRKIQKLKVNRKY